jgi:hypothetical protein
VTPTFSNIFVNDPLFFYAEKWSRCDLHSGTNDTAETCTEVSMTPLCKCDTAVTFGTHIRVALATFKENINLKNIHRKIFLHYIYNIHTKIWGLTEDRFLSQRCHWHRCDENRRFRSWSVSRMWSHIKKGSNLCIRDLGGVVWWKKPVVENLMSGSL